MQSLVVSPFIFFTAIFKITLSQLLLTNKGIKVGNICVDTNKKYRNVVLLIFISKNVRMLNIMYVMDTIYNFCLIVKI